MTPCTVLLIRHGLCDPVGQAIAGRAPGVHLNDSGRRQARALDAALALVPLAAVYSSPLERARETAEPLADRIGQAVTISPGLQELDFGDWTGRTLASLAGDPIWQRFNQQRGVTRIPGGETMDEVVARAAPTVSGVAAEHPGSLIAAVTHGDVIRALVAHWAGMPLDSMLRLEVAPASVSAVRFTPEPRLILLNWLTDLGAAL